MILNTKNGNRIGWIGIVLTKLFGYSGIALAFTEHRTISFVLLTVAFILAMATAVTAWTVWNEQIRTNEEV